MADIKLKPTDPPLYYIGIDGTDALDTVVWGHLWNALFGWRNLLWEIDLDTTDKQRRVDKAHPLLPILRESRKHLGNNYADTCIMPDGKDGNGLDSKWPSQTDPNSNLTIMNQNADSMKTFILSPSADQATSSLNDSGQGVVANVVYLSSHGLSIGNMPSAYSFANMFALAEAVSKGQQFSGPDWLLLSSCRTLAPSTHSDWRALMDSVKPLRGIVGFQEGCPLAEGSANIFAAFINRLARGKTILAAWSETLTAMGLGDAWVVLCHENAQGDTIANWNARKLKSITPGTSKVLMFDKATPNGQEVVPRPDLFEAFWSKGSTMITAANRQLEANKIAPGDIVSITVKPPASVTTFVAGTTISITLIYIRPDYEHQAINVNKMFAIKGQVGASTPTTTKLNLVRPSSRLGPDDGDDSWILVVTGSPSEVTLTLECIDLDLSKQKQHNANYYFRIKLSAPSPIQFDFNRNGSILLK